MNSFGRKFRVSIFGESHGSAVGVVLDGVPAGLSLTAEDFAEDLCRRKAGGPGTTARIEADEPLLLSGVWEDQTTGAPLTLLFRNENVRSEDYRMFRDVPRPGHADYTAAVKWYDCNDPRGGGHFSGRLTLPVVAAGVVAKKILADATLLDEVPVPQEAIRASIVELGGIPRPETSCSSCGTCANEVLGAVGVSVAADSVSGTELPEVWTEALAAAASVGDSLGAVVECRVPLSAGIGEPFWDSVESVIAHAVFSIPGVRGIEFGDGFMAAAMRGSEHNDPFGPDGKPSKNGAGGVNGGITNGAELCFRVAFKPTSSIARFQKTYDFSERRMTDLKISGRHDICFALRTPVIVEAMTAISLADLVLMRQ